MIAVLYTLALVLLLLLWEVHRDVKKQQVAIRNLTTVKNLDTPYDRSTT